LEQLSSHLAGTDSSSQCRYFLPRSNRLRGISLVQLSSHLAGTDSISQSGGEFLTIVFFRAVIDYARIKQIFKQDAYIATF
jgi:hypothetical protein